MKDMTLVTVKVTIMVTISVIQKVTLLVTSLVMKVAMVSVLTLVELMDTIGGIRHTQKCSILSDETEQTKMSTLRTFIRASNLPQMFVRTLIGRTSVVHLS